ncbi:Na+/H+ antiporter NhaC [Clostridium argentinense CDC 2741]|uniref:Na+/H+ antiporter NhaC n=1 Tax=Clostridium argentinense CDC 2741 TaxID=1418104 RepID=A0A0C1RCZ2_9CLOT|nr:Na+/H+ antiporter NhaC [Clostridium argentinense]ARC84860.1 Na+/H+ antiporter NhaC [Clostridium argentinense]KIE48246.1 Na+/H+ antiporter NhaC [Clostridium argentinense CDC 2741]NFF41773.1 Na+/H+ antiporter NhaC [Clostridium argentinense]NFP51618.1 Na+/H+ antiporter NhaC [Clostridium argentinense]NFP74807.1 Na+/H+ antiporter NhaC [Clostridium argentinense]
MSNEIRKPKLLEALLPIIILAICLCVGIIFYEASAHIPLVIGSIIASLVALRLGFKWKDLEKGFINSIQMSMQSIIILMIIGIIIGSWILSGTVPTMIYYGLKIISPGIFLLATCIMCSIVSLATGSSWTTVGTVGIALLGIGQGLGFSTPLVAGAVISGAYFGDKMSPLSDTTNLAPAMAGSELFDHIKHMIYTTGPSMIIALVLYGILGLKYAGKELDVTQINIILDGLQRSFNITPLLLIPPVIVITLVVKKIPAIPGLIAGAILGGLFAILFQSSSFGDVINVMNLGYVGNSGVKMVDELLNRGGLQSMMSTVSLIMCAMTFGGIMEKSGCLGLLAESLLKLAVNTGSLILVTVVSCIFTNLISGDQYLSIVIPGRMYKDEYAKRGLAPKNLSRTLEDAGTMTSCLIPWSNCGAFMSSTLSVPTLSYLPFTFLNLINPLVAIFYGYTGITIEKIKPENMESEKNSSLNI